MKRKNLVYLIVIIVSVILSVISVFGIIRLMFSFQYNKNGVSHFLVITIDRNRPKEYIGNLEGHEVYIENLDIDGTCFRNIEAENVPIKYALDNKLVSIDEWRKYAFIRSKDGDYELLIFENYEIAVSSKECIIRPLSKNILKYDCKDIKGVAAIEEDNIFYCKLLSTKYEFTMSNINDNQMKLTTSDYGLTKVNEDGTIDLNDRAKEFIIDKGKELILSTQTMDYSEEIILNWN